MEFHFICLYLWWKYSFIASIMIHTQGNEQKMSKSAQKLSNIAQEMRNIICTN